MALTTFPDQIVSALFSRVSGPGGPDLFDLRVAGTPGNPGIFRWTNTSDVPAEVQRIVAVMRTATPATLGAFGDLPELANGLLIQFVDQLGAVTADLTATSPIVRNTDFYFLTGDGQFLTTIGGKTVVPVVYEAHTAEGLAIPSGHSMQIVVQDDLTGLNEFRAALTGRVEATGAFGTASR